MAAEILKNYGINYNYKFPFVGQLKNQFTDCGEKLIVLFTHQVKNTGDFSGVVLESDFENSWIKGDVSDHWMPEKFERIKIDMRFE